jgi:hypothetical protein
MGDFKDLHETTEEVLPVSQRSPVVPLRAARTWQIMLYQSPPVHRTAAERLKAAVRGLLLGPGLNSSVSMSKRK